MGDTIKQNKKQDRIVKSQTATNIQSKRIEIPTNIREIIKSINPKIDVEIEVQKDIKQQIENNEMNNIKFYDIMSFDNTKKKGKGNFKSRRYPSDLAQIRGTKFFSKPNYNRFELERLKEIKKTPGKRLLMSEIYSQLEENFDEDYQEDDLGHSMNGNTTKIQDFSSISIIKAKQNTSSLPYINQSSIGFDSLPYKDTQLEKEIEDLDSWQKDVKKLKKLQKIKDEENLRKAEQNLVDLSKGKQSKFFPRQKQRTRTLQADQNSDDEDELLSPKRINERMRNFAQKNKESVMLIAKKQFTELENSKDFSTPRLSTLTQSPKVYLVGLLKNSPVIKK